LGLGRGLFIGKNEEGGDELCVNKNVKQAVHLSEMGYFVGSLNSTIYQTIKNRLAQLLGGLALVKQLPQCANCHLISLQKLQNQQYQGSWP
jgi:hypothetical protein